ncbi:ribosomal protein L1p/L10e family [Tasmannia lanceolata]|uniref:ribosomal protein L1p/L10e family n=1 Tax=Tasmannia lanceolata TaxID=3420 RepID=UPI0040639628
MAALEIFISHIRRYCTKPSPSQISILLRSSSSPSPSFISDLGFHKRSSSSTLGFKSSNFTSRFILLGFPRSFSSSSSSDIGSEDSAKTPKPSPIIKPVSYPTKPKDPSSEHESPNQPSPLEKPLPPRRPREVAGSAVFRQPETDSERGTDPGSQPWTREDIRYVKDVPSISPVSYPTRVAPLPEDRVSVEEAPKEELKEEERKENVQMEQEKRRIETNVRLRRVLRVEEEEVPFPMLIKAEKKKEKVVMDLLDAIKEVKANAKRNFIETVEAHVNLGVNPRRGDQMVRGAATLPHGTGKMVRIAVFAEGTAADEARAAGADIVGGDELIEEIRKGGGKLNFDKCISTPTFMPRLGKIARILGPRGLMPNPKLGSVTSDIAGAVKDAKCGRVDFKIDKTAIVHVGLGKVNFSEAAIRENVGAFVNALLLAKPVGLKKTSKYAGYMNSFTLSSTMGQGFPVSIQSLSMAADHYNKQQQLK